MILIGAAVIIVIVAVLLCRSNNNGETASPLPAAEQTQVMIEERTNDFVYQDNLKKFKEAQDDILKARKIAKEEFLKWEVDFLATNTVARELKDKIISSAEQADTENLLKEYETLILSDPQGRLHLQREKTIDAELEKNRQNAAIYIGSKIRTQAEKYAKEESGQIAKRQAKNFQPVSVKKPQKVSSQTNRIAVIKMTGEKKSVTNELSAVEK